MLYHQSQLGVSTAGDERAEVSGGWGASRCDCGGEEPGEPQPVSARDYETAGFVLDGKAELQLEGQTVLLEKGDSWIVPKGSQHTYKVLEAFTAVEATSPPAEVHDRDA